MNRAAPRLDVVIPVLNEAHVLEKSVTTVRMFLRTHFPFACRVVIVDNGSIDGTREIGQRLADDLDDVGFVHLEQPGRGRALRQAWMQSEASPRTSILSGGQFGSPFEQPPAGKTEQSNVAYLKKRIMITY